LGNVAFRFAVILKHGSIILIIYKDLKGMVSQNTTVIFEGAFLLRLKTTCFGPFTGPYSGLKWSVRGDYTM
jgi:hypothetical protein